MTGPRRPFIRHPTMAEIKDQAIIGLVSVALAHIDNGDIENAEDTLRGSIMQLDGTSEAVGE